MAQRIHPKVPVRVYLSEWRDHFHLTQQQVGDRLGGIAAPVVSRWETAKRMPSVDVLAAYAEALGIHVATLYRPPSALPSLDVMIADSPDEIRRQATDVVTILVRKGA